jgi:uncharacterized protein (DUF3820 family)
MTVSDANIRFRDISLEEALQTPVAFGKYTAKYLSDVPYAYIKWISGNVEPALSGAGVVYRMIFAARTIVQEMHLPDSMPPKQKYTATPKEIMSYDSNQATVPRERLHKGHWEIPNGKNHQIYPSASSNV